MAATGFSVGSDAERVFRWQETLPPWHAVPVRVPRSKPLRNYLSPIFAAMGVLLGFGVAPILVGQLIMGSFYGAIGWGVGFLLFRLPPNLHTTPGLRTIFAFELEVDLNGMAQLTSERLALQHGRENSTYHFASGDIASIERRSFAEQYPDEMSRLARHYSSGPARRIQDERLPVARTADEITIVLRTGEEISAGWQLDRNSAARMQYDLREFILETQNWRASVRKAGNIASLRDDEDAPL